MGGKNNPENIISLTPEEHAKAHQELYEKYGKIEDYLAWKGLAGFMGKERIIFNLMSENGKKVGNRMKLEGKGIFDPEKQKTEKYQEGIKLGGKIQGRKMAESGHCKRVAPLGGGKNLGKKSWFNPNTGKETQSFESPGEEWAKGVNMNRINVESLRENSDNVKGTYWIANKETGETRMIFPEDEIPEGFTKGRIFSKKNVMDLHNTSDKFPNDEIPQVSIEFSYIIFNPGKLRWEFIPTVNKERLIKISHTDYYGLVWARDCYLNLMGIKGGRSKFQFTANSVDEIQTVLKDWREYFRTLDILSGDKLKKFRRTRYEKKLESLKGNYSFLEGIRRKIMN
jgi:hypothetical protein